MKEEILKFIEGLASKFGTTTEHLWLILIKQARIAAITNLIVIAAMLVAGFGLFGIHKILSHPHPLFEFDTDLTITFYKRYGYKVIVPFIVGIITWGIFLIGALAEIGNTITGIYNPGYWALNDIGRRFDKE